MKISELIKCLQKAQEEYGDKELVIDNAVSFSSEPAYSSVDEPKFYSVYARDDEVFNIPKGEYLEIEL